MEIILERGELQVSDKERDVQLSGILSDIVKIIVEKCVHPVTKRRFTVETIKTAIKDSHFPIKHDLPAKRQALQCIKVLQTRYKIARGEMKIRITFDSERQDVLVNALKKLEIE